MPENIYNESHGHLVVSDPSSSAIGGEAEGREVIGRPELYCILYKSGCTPMHLDQWIQLVTTSAQDIDGVVKCHGPARKYVGGDAIGLVMDRAKGMRLDNWKPIFNIDRVAAAHSAATTVAELFVRNLIYGDLKLDNAFINPRTRAVTFIDLLSVSTANRVTLSNGISFHRQFNKGMYEFLAPELLGKNGASIQHNEATLAHSLLVFIWTLLKNEPPMAMKASSGLVVPIADIKAHGFYGRFAQHPTWMEPIDEGIPFKRLPHGMRNIFNQAFSRGRLNPSLRPSLREVMDELNIYFRSQVAFRVARNVLLFTDF